MSDLPWLLLVPGFLIEAHISEDCLPEGELHGLGGTLPEFEVLGYGENNQAYYIRCGECLEKFADPKTKAHREWVNAWNMELGEAELKLNPEDPMSPNRAKLSIIHTKSNVAGGTTKQSSPSTMTTEDEGYYSFDLSAPMKTNTKGFPLDRDVIVLD